LELEQIGEPRMLETAFLEAVKELELQLYDEVSAEYDYDFNAPGNPKAFLRAMQSYWCKWVYILDNAI
jgi:hypothetical protein